MASEDEDFVGINEIAEMANVSRQAVSNWRKRASDFPDPIVTLASGPVFRRTHVRAWLRRRKVPMSRVISTINLKGGVGKTTTTVALAEIFSSEFHKRVLVIDLDPQTNATIMLIGEERWRDLNKKDYTLARLFKDALDPENPSFDLGATLQKKVSDVSAARSIDLLPSSLDLISVQDKLASAPPGEFFAVNPTELLWRAVKPILDDYDIVIVDCPPNLGIITLNGLRISEGYIIPTIPDVLSTYGIPQIVSRIRLFSKAIAETIEPIGIIITKYQENSTVHRNTLKQLRRSSKLPPVFKTIIPLANQFSAAAEYTGHSTIKQKWGYNNLAEKFHDLAEEILDKLED